MISHIRALVFDLGGVLIDIDFARALSAWQAHTSLSADQLREAFRLDPAYERHERGQMSSTEYFAHLASVLKLAAEPAEIEVGWCAIFKGEITETRLLVEHAARQLPCYAFTNTNGSHMRAWTALYPQVVQSFQRVFASHEMGMRKPERRAFDSICETIRCDPDSVLFFDDLAENVQAARSLRSLHLAREVWRQQGEREEIAPLIQPAAASTTKLHSNAQEPPRCATMTN